MAISREELANCILYQIGALSAFLAAEQVELSHIKPHGALYGMAAHDAEIAHAIADAADVFNVPIYGLAARFTRPSIASAGMCSSRNSSSI